MFLTHTQSGRTEWVLLRLSGQWAQCRSDIKWAIPQFNGFMRNSHGTGSESCRMMSTKRRWEALTHAASPDGWVREIEVSWGWLLLPLSCCFYWPEVPLSNKEAESLEMSWGSAAPCDLSILETLSVNGLQTMAWDLQGNWRQRRPKLWLYKKLAPLSRIQFNTDLVKTVQTS